MQLNGNKNALLGGNLGGNNFVGSGKLGNSGNFGASMNLGNGANYGAGSNFGANSNFGSTGVNKFANFPIKGSENFDNGDKFVLIGEVKDDSVYFWLCICGCESREYMYTLCYDDYQNIKKGTTFHRFQKSQSESVRLLDECPHKISRHDFSINLDIAKKNGEGRKRRF